jgi:hypothetical protein
MAVRARMCPRKEGWNVKHLILIVTAGLLGTVSALYLATGNGVPPVYANPLLTPLYLDLAGVEYAGGTCLVTPVGTIWHEIWPIYGLEDQETGYEDNGDGVVSVSDFIWIIRQFGGSTEYYVSWVGPSYFLSREGGTAVYEPLDEPEWGNPICQVWQDVSLGWPPHVNHHVDAWADNGDGIPSVCDTVVLDGVEWHIDHVGFNIFVEDPHVGTDQRSWGRVKRMFR